MTNKEIIPRFKEITPGLPTKRVVPDRVVTAAEADFEAAEAVMTGYEYIDEALPPNWPPGKRHHPGH
jgi:voltage-gated potassium channel Kch